MGIEKGGVVPVTAATSPSETTGQLRVTAANCIGRRQQSSSASAAPQRSAGDNVWHGQGSHPVRQDHRQGGVWRSRVLPSAKSGQHRPQLNRASG